MERISSWHLGFVVGMHARYICEQRALESYIAGGIGVCIQFMGIVQLIFLPFVLQSLDGGYAGSIRCFEMFQATVSGLANG